MPARTRGPLAAACLIALTFAASVPGTAGADTTSTVGWVRLAQLSPGSAPLDVYVYASGGTTAQLVLKDLAYGTLSPYESLAPGNYRVAVRAAGNAVTSDPVTSTQVVVAAGQADTVAALGASPALALQVLTDKLDIPQGKADVRVVEASMHNPTVSVSAGGDTIAANLSFPNVTSYQPVDPGSHAVRITTQTGATTAQLNFAADSTYTVAVIDGSASTPQILDLSDATGISAPPKGGVSTGFGGTATQRRSGTDVFPVGEVLLLIGAVGAVAFGISWRRKQIK